MASDCALAKIKVWGAFSALHAFMCGSEEVGKLLGFSTSVGTWGGGTEWFFLLQILSSKFCVRTMDSPK
jgi:hypothetical protein